MLVSSVKQMLKLVNMINFENRKLQLITSAMPLFILCHVIVIN